jgi:hypothetical protein
MLVVAVSAASFNAQRRRPRQPPKASTQRPSTGVDYTKFSHATKQHQAVCSSCHKAPSSNWVKTRGYPDIADYPDHDACVRCHRPQFFKSAQPAICSNCHTRVSPRDGARFPFRNPLEAQQFTIEFPHDKHQDVIAAVKQGPHLLARVLNSRSFAHAPQQRIDYNNCTICHGTNSRTLTAPAGGWPDGFVPNLATFKTVPATHGACFNCHWRSQKPTKDDCGGCHKLVTPYIPGVSPQRISLKFSHEGGGEKQVHVAECTTCHINITKAASLRGLKPDVPITGCTECHNKSGLREDLGKELAALDKNRAFVCAYCHTSDVGRRDPPPGHYLVADRPPLKRKDIK